ncbi:hypothetical protein ACXOVK_09220, partial [Streptococcus thermophilus]
ILVDKNSQGKERDWRGRKILSLKLADIFKELQYKKTFVKRVVSCGDTLYVQLETFNEIFLSDIKNR